MDVEITMQDQTLIASAKEMIKKRYAWERHHVSAAVLTRTGEIFTAVHLEASLSRVTVCAEAWLSAKRFRKGTRSSIQLLP